MFSGQSLVLGVRVSGYGKGYRPSTTLSSTYIYQSGTIILTCPSAEITKSHRAFSWLHDLANSPMQSWKYGPVIGNYRSNLPEKKLNKI